MTSRGEALRRLREISEQQKLARAASDRMAPPEAPELASADESAVKRAAGLSVGGLTFSELVEDKAVEDVTVVDMTERDPIPSDGTRVQVIDCERGDVVTVYAVLLALAPRLLPEMVGRKCVALVRQFTVSGARPLSDKDAIPWAAELAVADWNDPLYGPVTNYGVPVGEVGATVLRADSDGWRDGTDEQPLSGQ